MSFLTKIILFLFVLSYQNTWAQNKYLDMPNGSSVEVPAGMSYFEAVEKAMKKYPEAYGLKRIEDEKQMDVDWFNECRAKLARDAKTDAALFQLIQSCRYQAVPQKCRTYQIAKDSLGNESGDERVKCVQECARANPYSKNFGECKKG